MLTETSHNFIAWFFKAELILAVPYLLVLLFLPCLYDRMDSELKGQLWYQWLLYVKSIMNNVEALGDVVACLIALIYSRYATAVSSPLQHSLTVNFWL